VSNIDPRKDPNWLTDEDIASLVSHTGWDRKTSDVGSPTLTQIDQPMEVGTPTAVGRSEAPSRGVQKYPWERWFDGNVHKVVAGTDFAVPIDQFRVHVGNTARRKGLYIQTTKQKDGVTLILRVFKTEQERDMAKYGEDSYDDGYGDLEPEDA
jgi:hypothetical protein